MMSRMVIVMMMMSLLSAAIQSEANNEGGKEIRKLHNSTKWTEQHFFVNQQGSFNAEISPMQRNNQ